MAKGKLYNSVFSSLSVLTTPDPLQAATYGRPYVDFGVDNMYPSYTADLVTISPTHQAIIDSKRSFLNGDLKIDTEVESHILDLEDINGLGDTLEELIDDTAANLSVYDSFYWEVVYNRQRTRIVAINNIPYEHVRVGKYNEDGVIDTVYVSPDWSRKYIKRNKPKALAVFNPKSVDTDSQVIIARIKKPNQPYYTVPSYMSAVQFILLEDDIAEINRNDVTNGFFPSMIMNFFDGDPSEDDKAELESYINAKFKGTNGAKLMMFFNNDPEKKVQLDTFTPPNLGDYSDKMIPLIENKILSAHRAFHGIVGISTGSGFSNKADELDAAFQLYVKNVIVPLQKLIINALRKVYKFNGIDADISFQNELIAKDEDMKEGVANAEINTEDTVEEDINPINTTEDDK